MENGCRVNSGTTSPGKSLNHGPSRDYGVCGAAREALAGILGDDLDAASTRPVCGLAMAPKVPPPRAARGRAARVTGVRILVTGAGSGVGKATAALLAGRGHEVVATARDRAALDGLEVAARLCLDVTDAASVDEIRLELGWVDALVNNAAISFGGPIEHVAMEHVRQMFETNVFGPVRLIQAFVPGMRDRRSGVVVNISSVAGHVAQPLSGYYAATKHALEAISEALYVELAHFGVRVVVVEPGFITPGMKTHATAGALEAYEPLDAQLAQLADKMPGGALAGPEVVAKVIADAIDNDAGALRRRVGDDANLILSARNTLGDEEFETAMRKFVGLTW